MQKISNRQLDILEYIKNNQNTSNRNIKDFIVIKYGNISRFTILRDIDTLLKNKLIKKIGRGRSVYYQEANDNKLLEYVEVEKYFVAPSDKRTVKSKFNFEVFDETLDLYSRDELSELSNLNKDYLSRIKKTSPTILKKEFERLTIELSWKSSSIEGNTYSLIDTEVLIKENKEAKGHKKEEAIMILNHKKALDYIKGKKSHYEKLTLRKIENIHDLLIQDLGVKRGLRSHPVGITGTIYRPLDNVYQIREAMEMLLKTVNKIKDPFSKATISILLISYIQPFEDGNKRTGRLLGNAILMANNICPLSYRSVDEGEYKKAVILFYEQNNLRYFKELFIEQYKFAVENYF